MTDWMKEFPKELDGYICRTCGTKARVREEHNHEWCCPKCGFSTYSVFVGFKDVTELADNMGPADA